ncbi:ATPase [Paenibacillus sp. D9]|uniref:DNA polymerase III subunit delta' n=2 Tax=unclassified Paenibacillus TaxID=185978 RepID=UPI0006201BF0|nr:DNA polymerase III subunit delta' [Paenibacillus sp. D9]KKC48372.1 ATPase [Paenibacillus sp. D9]
MRLAEIPGQEKAKQILRHALQSGKVSHAYLFHGPGGTGRLQTALAFAQALFCTAGGDDACGECLECRKFEHGNQPDLHRIAPDGNSIKLGQIDDLQREMSYRTADPSRRKVYIMEKAESMTPPASNSLLKFLEEPVSPTVAILLATHAGAVLPTIASRTQPVPFLPYSPKEMLEQLAQEGYPAAHVRAAVHLASGLDGCRAVIEQIGFAEIRNVVIQLGKESTSRFTAGMVTVQQRLIKADLGSSSQLLLSLLVLWFRDMIHYQAGRSEQMVFIDQLDWISKHAYTKPAAYWVSCMEHAMEAAGKIKANVAPQLAIEQLLVRLQEG